MLASSRLSFIDRTRGLIMMFMALDHALYFWSFGRVSNEGLPILKNGLLTFQGGGSPSVLAYAVMLLSSIAAPGFLFIAGYVLALSVKRREEAGSSSWEISKHLWLRGIALVALQVFVASPAFNLPGFRAGDLGASLGVFLSLSVLSTIGIGFILLALGRHLSAWKVLALAVIVYLLSESLLPRFAGSFPYISWTEQGLCNLLVLAVPFSSQYLLNNNFPVIAWLLPLSLGWFYGNTYRPEKGLRHEGKRFGRSGAVSLGLFFVLRTLGQGDYLRVASPWQFFVLSKYPPSPDYLLFYVGIVLLLMSLFIQLQQRAGAIRILEDFGKTPLFFYNTHLWLYALIPTLFNYYNRLPIWEGMGVWLLGLLVLYPLCRWSVKVRASWKAAHKPRPSLS